MSDPKLFDLGTLDLACGTSLPGAQLAYQTYGTLSPGKDNVVLYPTSYAAHHSDIDWLIGEDRVLDPSRYFIVIANQLGNGLSSSPSTLAPPFQGLQAPAFSHLVYIAAPERLLRVVFGVERIALGYGWSMGGQQVLHWGALMPDRIDRILATCSAARTSDHNTVFLKALKATLVSDGAYSDGMFHNHPAAALRAFARIYATMALSHGFYRARIWADLGYRSLEDFLVKNWEASFAHRDAGNLLSMIDTWTRSDISDNAQFGGDLDAALRAIQARTLIMPCTTDQYFRAHDAEIECAKIPNAEFRPIESLWGHRAGNPTHNSLDEAVLRDAVRDLMAR